MSPVSRKGEAIRSLALPGGPVIAIECRTQPCGCGIKVVPREIDSSRPWRCEGFFVRIAPAFCVGQDVRRKEHVDVREPISLPKNYEPAR